MATKASNPKHALLEGIKEAFGEDATAVLPKDAKLPNGASDISISGGKYNCATEKPRVNSPSESLTCRSEFALHKFQHLIIIMP
jgi:hypothetical protein